jgi:hypothetical protein
MQKRDTNVDLENFGAKMPNISWIVEVSIINVFEWLLFSKVDVANSITFFIWDTYIWVVYG